jgi:hypothetical protein
MGESIADSRHTPCSDPGRYHAGITGLSADPGTIADRLELFVIHHDIARAIGFGVPAAAEGDRGLRLASTLLAAALARDPRPLTEHRAIGNYLYVTCRDFAMLAVSALRQQGIAARLRVGFASYFKAGHWLDHLVCEYRAGASWSVLDAQLGPLAREGFRIGFDIADVPEAGWRSAASVWRAVRAGEIDPAMCGLPSAGIAGAWWIAGSVIRDANALAGIEALPWDFWGAGLAFHATRAVTAAQAARIDLLAAALEPAPPDRDAAGRLLAGFAWACPSPAERAVLEGG